MSTTNRRPTAFNGFVLARPAVMGVAQLGFFLARTASAVPLPIPMRTPTWTWHLHDDEPKGEDSSLAVLYIMSFVLVLLGGAFAGLTIALMGQDNLNLRVLVSEGNETPTPAKVAAGKNADRVLKLLDKGKHWVLVTLLLANVIVNETLPVVLDRCLGGGVAAVVGSTLLIVIFGEILPQSICVRYGLPIGGFMSFPVLVLMWLMAPIAWPIAKLLDWVLGKHEGTIYKKSGLKTLVALHGTMGDARERLNTDEVTIIRAVLDLRGKEVGKVMTPMQDVFTLSADTVLDEEMMEHILTQGYSRIPIYRPGKEHDFVGMLLVKILITYDPEDGMRVSDFPLAALPETRRETNCLDILNYFQVGKSHMAIVSDHPGDDHGAVGIVTLEDVIEELIGEEIIDESDVYVDIHKAIRRINPAPKVRYSARKDSDFDKAELGTNGKANETSPGVTDKRTGSISAVSDIGMATSPKTITFMMRRGSTGGGGGAEPGPIPVRAKLDDLRQHLRHLGPSNPASNPRSRGTAAVTIKSVGAQPAGGQGIPATIGENQDAVVYLDIPPQELDNIYDEETPLLGDGATLERPKLTGKGGVQALRKSYGSLTSSEAQFRVAHAGSSLSQVPPEIRIDTEDAVVRQVAMASSASSAAQTSPEDQQAGGSSNPHSPTRSGGRETSSYGATSRSRDHTRSGSITESVVETGGIRKVVIMTSSGDEEEKKDSDTGRMAHVSEGEEDDENDEQAAGSSKAGEDLASPSSLPSAGGSGHGSSGGKKKSRRKKRKQRW